MAARIEASRDDGERWAAEVLRRHRMPDEEIRAVLAAEDPVTIDRLLELHAERLEEQLADERRALRALGQVLSEGRRLGG